MIATITLEDLVREARSNRAMRTASMIQCHRGENVEHVTFTQALDRSETGDESLVPEAEKLMDSLRLSVETQGREWQATVAGAYPVVPEFLMGRPDCMRGRVWAENESMPVRLVVDIFASCGFSGPQLRKRGLVMLALTMMLQRHRPVELAVLTSSLDAARTNPVGLLIPIHTKPINLSRAAFLFSPVFFRFLTASYLDIVLHVPPSIPADMNHKCKAELNLRKDDLYIEPAIGCGDETERILAHPQKWLQEQLDRIMGERA